MTFRPQIQDAKANFSPDGRIRWKLTRTWGNTPAACWIMCNPSTADAVTSDPTIDRCMRFTENAGLKSMIVVNIFPWISSDPKQILQRVRDAREKIPTGPLMNELRYNEAEVIRIARSSAMVIAAWGAIATSDIYTSHLGTVLTLNSVDLYCLGLTDNGSPIHPMARGKKRLSDDTKPRLWIAGIPQEEPEEEEGCGHQVD